MRKSFQPVEAIPRESPLLNRAVEGEVLFLYLAVSPSALRSVLIREDQGVQKPIYFTNRSLQGAKERYPQIKKVGTNTNSLVKEAEALLPSTRNQGPH